MSADIDKNSLRKVARARRMAAHGHNARGAARALAGHVMDALEDKPVTTIAAYWAIGSEIDVGPLMSMLVEKGWDLVLPVVVKEAQPLVFRRWKEGDALVEGPLKTLQPGNGQLQLTPEVIITPLLAFDGQGYRLGQGGGFYDRTLAKLQAAGGGVLCIGVAYAAQRVEAVPLGDFDRRLDFIVTEQGRV